jgi:acetyl-CoA C-acetyltransferase
MGALRVASGQYRTQLIVSWSPTEVGSLAEVQRLGADPYFHRRLPLDELAAQAMQARALLAAVPGLEAQAAGVLRKNRDNGARTYPDMLNAAPGTARPPLCRR